MTPQDIQDTLRANEGKRVRVTYEGGTVEVVEVHSVDDEGYVGSGPEGAEPAGYWTRFESVIHVEPV